jgi:hypothetical protein
MSRSAADDRRCFDRSDQVTRSQSGRVVNELIDGVDPDPAANNFVYDGAGRLSSAKVPGHTISYGFAPTGGCGVMATAGRNTNRTSVTDNAATYSYCYDQARPVDFDHRPGDRCYRL